MGGAGGEGERHAPVRADHQVGIPGVVEPLVVVEPAVGGGSRTGPCPLLVASEGRPVTVPDGLVNEVFQRALDALLPEGLPARRSVLAGPGLPVPDADADILLVPDHPQTGKTWTHAGPAYAVPLPYGVWL